MCEFRGTLIDAASREPISAGKVWVSVIPTEKWDRAAMKPTLTNDAGRFAQEICTGFGGSATWVIVPIATTPGEDPPETIYIAVERANLVGRSAVQLAAESRQHLKRHNAKLDLGELMIDLRP
jgi:hypothetical protein